MKTEQKEGNRRERGSKGHHGLIFLMEPISSHKKRKLGFNFLLLFCPLRLGQQGTESRAETICVKPQYLGIEIRALTVFPKDLQHRG